jgi:hypothetical protein
MLMNKRVQLMRKEAETEEHRLNAMRTVCCIPASPVLVCISPAKFLRSSRQVPAEFRRTSRVFPSVSCKFFGA